MFNAIKIYIISFFSQIPIMYLFMGCILQWLRKKNKYDDNINENPSQMNFLSQPCSKNDIKQIQKWPYSKYCMEQKENVFKQLVVYGISPKIRPSLERVPQYKQTIQRSKVNSNFFTSQIKDPRKLVQDSLTYPYSAIGLLSFKTSEGEAYSGTAFLIGQNFIMTAAHNIYDRLTHQRYVQFLFFPGLKGVQGKSYKAQIQFYPEEYETSEQQLSLNYDFAILKSKSKIGLEYGYFGLDFRGIEIDEQVKIAGYPCFIYEKGDQIPAKKRLYQDTGKYNMTRKQNKEIEANIQYTIGTSPGQSGSPIFYEINGNYLVIGIHTIGGYKFNSGILLDDQKRQNINQRVEQTKIIMTLNQVPNKNLSQIFLSEQIKKIDNIQISGDFRGAQQNFNSKKLYNLTSICLKDNNLGPEGVKELVSSVNNVKQLYLKNNTLGDVGVQHIASAKLKKLKILDLRNNSISKVGIQHLSAGNLNLTKLDLRNNLLEDSGVRILAQGNFSTLLNLNLGQNKIGPQGAKELAFGKLTNLTTLLAIKNKSGTNKIGNAGLKHMAYGNLKNLKTFDVGQNKIENEGLRDIAFGGMKEIKTLYLRFNQITDSGAMILASGSLIDLQHLDLRFNALTDQGAKNLAFGNFKKLKRLHLADNKISDKGAKAIAHGDLKYLTQINIQDNQIPQQAKKQIEAIFKQKFQKLTIQL